MASAGSSDSHSRDVILRDGRTLRLRPPVGADQRAVLEFFSNLDDLSRYQRFHGTRRVDASLLEGVLDPDWTEFGALIGVVASGPEERVVAIGSYARLRDRRMAEVAFVVATELQGWGVGTRLVEQLAAAAASEGITAFTAEVLASDDPMLRVFANSGFEIERSTDGAEVHVRFPIAQTERYLDALDQRDHTAVDRSIEPFFHPRSVAVIGASARQGAIGGAVFRNIVSGGFSGPVYAINRSGKPVAGHPALASVADVADPVDLAVVCVPAAEVLEATESALAKGIRAICVISAGFAESGDEGAALQQRLLSLVRSHGARLVGPNCLGIASTGTPHLNATFAPAGFPTGPVSVSSQSGAVGLAIIDELAARGQGISSFASIGNKADVSSNDLLEYWEDDDPTRVIALYLESFGNPRRFTRIARRVARGKPIVALKAGSTDAGARAAQSHTAAMSGSDSAVEGLFRQAGILRAHSLEQLVDLTEVLCTQPLPRGRRVAIVSNAGGLGILCADACADAGLKMASLSAGTVEQVAAALGGTPATRHIRTPVDLGGTATADVYAAAVPALIADRGVDAVIVIATPTAAANRGALIEAAARTVRETTEEKPILVVITGEWTTQVPGGLACFRYPEAAARALGGLVERSEWLRRPVGRVRHAGVDRAGAERIVAAGLTGSGRGWLDPEATHRLLKCYGLPMVSQQVVHDRAEALASAAQSSYPVIVKTAIPGAHKTKLHGVVPNLRNADELFAAVARVDYPAIIQPMVTEGTEILIGGVQDPLFGPVVACGLGGTLSDLLRDAHFVPAPLSDTDAAELVASGKAGQLLAEVRGLSTADTAALIDIARRVGQLLTEIPDIQELDLNPVIIRPGSCLAVDARIRVARPTAHPQLKTW